MQDELHETNAGDRFVINSVLLHGGCFCNQFVCLVAALGVNLRQQVSHKIFTWWTDDLKGEGLGQVSGGGSRGQ